MRQKNDTENMLILSDKSKLLSHCQYAVQFVTLFKACVCGEGNDFRDKQ